MAYSDLKEVNANVPVPKKRRNLFAPITPTTPLETTAQQMQDASGVVKPGAVGVDDPMRAQSAKMAQQYAGMLSGQQPKTNEQVINERNARLFNQTNTTRAINPNSDTDGMDAIMRSMYTSPEEEMRMRKSSLANRRIMAVADALRHIGNIYHTVNYAPSQKFNSPVPEEEQRYNQGKALRDAANMRFFNYQQAKAAQDAKQRQWEAEFGMKNELTAAQIKSIEDKAAEMIRHNTSLEEINRWKAEQSARYQEQNQKERERTNRVREGIMGMNAQTNRMRANHYINGGGGSGRGMSDYEVTEVYDIDPVTGKKKGTTKRRKTIYPNGQVATQIQTRPTLGIGLGGENNGGQTNQKRLGINIGG